MPGLVIDIPAWKQSKKWIASLRPATQYKKSDIGKTFWPPMNAHLEVKVAPIRQEEFTAMPPERLPSSFDWNKQPGVTLNAVQNQGTCGACWAVSSATALGDQWGIASEKPAVLLAANNITNCTDSEDCNQGGNPADAGATAARDGLVEDKCWPYSSDCNCPTQTPGQPVNPQCTAIKAGCPRWYTQASSIRAGFVVKANVSVPQSVSDIDVPATFELIKQTVYKSGPMVTGFKVPSDFMSDPNMSNPSYIFRSSAGDEVGLHAVVITGWGYDNAGKLYWVIRNSWGTDWGNNGYFNVYAYDAQYPMNSLGFDVPLFQSESLSRAVWNARISSLPTIESLGYAMILRDIPSGPYCGTTLWLPDLKRSPDPNHSNGGGSGGNNPTPSSSGGQNKTVVIVGIVIAIIAILALIIGLLTKKLKRVNT